VAAVFGAGAWAGQSERLRAVQDLFSGVQLQVGLGVVDRFGHTHGHPTDRVDDVLEPGEIHRDHVVQVYPGDGFDRVALTPHTAVAHGVVEPVRSSVGAFEFTVLFTGRKVDDQITRQVDHGQPT